MPEFDYTPPFISLMEQGARVKDCLFLAAGVPDPRLFPAAEMARAYRRALLRNTRQSLSIGPAEGHPKAREMLAGMLAAVRGMGVTLDNIQLTRGILVGLGLVARAIVKPGDAVAVENPGYPGAWEVLREVGAEVVPIPVDSEGMDVDALERLLATRPLRAVFVTPHHQYPTTAVMSEPRRSHLMALARKHRFAIIEDDYDHAFHYEGQPIWPLASRDNSGTVIYLASLSKLMGPGLRVGFVVGPKELINRLAILRRRMEVQGDIALEMAMAEFSEDGELGATCGVASASIKNAATYWSKPYGVIWATPCHLKCRRGASICGSGYARATWMRGPTPVPRKRSSSIPLGASLSTASAATAPACVLPRSTKLSSKKRRGVWPRRTQAFAPCRLRSPLALAFSTELPSERLCPIVVARP